MPRSRCWVGVALLLAGIPRFSLPQNVPLRTEVENGLCDRVRIEGRPFAHWSLLDRMKYYRVPGVEIAVIDQGRIAWIGSYGVKRAGFADPVNADTLFQAASVSKVVTAVTVLRLVDQRRFSLDAPVAPLLKSWRFPDGSPPVTVRQLLSHNAAINWPAGETALPPSGALPTNIDRLLGRLPALNRPVIVDGVPGSGFRYSNGGYLILGQLVADATGEDFGRAAKQLVLAPLGMRRSTFDVFTPLRADPNMAHGHGADGQEEQDGWRIVGMAEGGLWTAAAELAGLVIDIQRSAAGKGGLLSEGIARQMVTRQNERWGLGVQVDGSGTDAHFSHDGSTPGFKARLFGYAATGKGVVILTNGDRGGELTEELMRSVAAAYHWPDFQVTTRRVIHVAPAALADYVGQFQMAPGALATITMSGDKLYAEVRGRDKTEILPDAPGHFFMLNGPDVQFVRDSKGDVTEVVFDGTFHARKVSKAH